MFKFFNIVGIIVSMLFTFFLFIFLVRIGNDKSAFIGVGDIANYVEKIDFWEPFNDVIDDATDLTDTFQDEFGVAAYKFNNITYQVPNFVDVNNPADFFNNVGKFFSSLWNVLGQIFDAIGQIGSILRVAFQMVWIALRFVFAIIQWVFYMIGVIFNFIQFVAFS